MDFNREKSLRGIFGAVAVSLGLFVSTMFIPSLVHADDMMVTNARVISAEGQVQTKASSGEWTEAKRGSYLQEGSEVSTDETSSAIVTVGPGRTSSITLKPSTKVTLSALDPVKVKLDSGEVIAIVKGMGEGSTFQVMNSTAVAAVKGTTLYVSQDVIAVADGSADITFTDGSSVHLEAGQEISLAGKEVSSISTEIQSDIDGAEQSVRAAEQGMSSSGDGGSAGQQNIQVPSTP